MRTPARKLAQTSGDPGLRDRQKAERREIILRSAEALFAEQGIDSTTISSIADAAGVSPPTVFNYFGTKDNLLNSLIFEGVEVSRRRWASMQMQEHTSLAMSLTSFLAEVTEKTIEIAGKRVWRYAEAAFIRHPNTEFESRFRQLDSQMIEEMARFFSAFELRMRSGHPPDALFLAKMFFDRWTAHYLAFIKNDAMTVEAHTKDLAEDIEKMVDLLFEDACALRPVLKPGAD